MSVLRDLLKERESKHTIDKSQTYVIGAAHRDSDDGEWNRWKDTGDTYALVLAKSPLDAIAQYLRSRPDMVSDSAKNWSFDKDAKFMAGQRVWTVVRFDDYPSSVGNHMTYEGKVKPAETFKFEGVSEPVNVILLYS